MDSQRRATRTRGGTRGSAGTGGPHCGLGAVAGFVLKCFFNFKLLSQDRNAYEPATLKLCKQTQTSTHTSHIPCHAVQDRPDIKHEMSWCSWTALESRADEVPCEAASSEGVRSYPETRPILRDVTSPKPRKTLSFSDVVELREFNPNARQEAAFVDREAREEVPKSAGASQAHKPDSGCLEAGEGIVPHEARVADPGDSAGAVREAEHESISLHPSSHKELQLAPEPSSHIAPTRTLQQQATGPSTHVTPTPSALTWQDHRSQGIADGAGEEDARGAAVRALPAARLEASDGETQALGKTADEPGLQGLADAGDAPVSINIASASFPNRNATANITPIDAASLSGPPVTWNTGPASNLNPSSHKALQPAPKPSTHMGSTRTLQPQFTGPPTPVTPTPSALTWQNHRSQGIADGAGEEDARGAAVRALPAARLEASDGETQALGKTADEPGLQGLADAPVSINTSVSFPNRNATAENITPIDAASWSGRPVTWNTVRALPAARLEASGGETQALGRTADEPGLQGLADAGDAPVSINIASASFPNRNVTANITPIDAASLSGPPVTWNTGPASNLNPSSHKALQPAPKPSTHMGSTRTLQPQATGPPTPVTPTPSALTWQNHRSQGIADGAGEEDARGAAVRALPAARLEASDGETQALGKTADEPGLQGLADAGDAPVSINIASASFPNRNATANITPIDAASLSGPPVTWNTGPASNLNPSSHKALQLAPKPSSHTTPTRTLQPQATGPSTNVTPTPSTLAWQNHRSQGINGAGEEDARGAAVRALPASEGETQTLGKTADKPGLQGLAHAPASTNIASVSSPNHNLAAENKVTPTDAPSWSGPPATHHLGSSHRALQQATLAANPSTYTNSYGDLQPQATQGRPFAPTLATERSSLQPKSAAAALQPSEPSVLARWDLPASTDGAFRWEPSARHDEAEKERQPQAETKRQEEAKKKEEAEKAYADEAARYKAEEEKKKVEEEEARRDERACE